MALHILPRRLAARSVQGAGIRSFSTPVNESVSPTSPTIAPPPPEFSNTLRNAVSADRPRYDWTRDEIREIYNTPLMELAFQSVRPQKS